MIQVWSETLEVKPCDLRNYHLTRYIKNGMLTKLVASLVIGFLFFHSIKYAALAFVVINVVGAVLSIKIPNYLCLNKGSFCRMTPMMNQWAHFD